ncbi:hypothetical protein T03_11864 [Trichinella britovi]|uniref:Uncharacterized protein n=1 Tax=Trichinella britovi TaxID=45882 RepID=A0A0V1CFW9_TRIBR|nr:hypothetical protein T03_11864 [Trichinella britovi]
MTPKKSYDAIADNVVQHQNKRRFQRKPDKLHHLYSVWSITLCNSSKNVSPNDGKLTIYVSRRTAPLFNYSLLRNVLITHCIALFGHFGVSLQQIR